MDSTNKVRNIYNKSKSIQLKGVAILLMVFLHVFFHSTKNTSNNYVLSVFGGENYSIINILLKLAHICVPLFIFAAGYAACVLVEKDSFSFKKIVGKLYPKIWIVLIIFVPIMIAMGKANLDPVEMLLNATGFYYSYCKEWWFFGLYIALSLLLLILKKTNILSHTVLLIAISVFLMVVGYGIKIVYPKFIYDVVGGQVYPFLIKQPIYFSGYLCYKYSIFERIVNSFKHKWYYLLILLWLFEFTNIPESFYLPFVVPGVVLVLTEMKKGKVIEKILEFLGKNSTYMWLTHSILIFSVATNVVYFFHYSVIDYLVVLVLDIPIAIALNYLEKAIRKGFGKIISACKS